MADPIVLIRGNSADITISGLLDAQGNPTVFGVGDILVWTAKATPDSETAYLQKTSADGGITIDIGTDQATVHVFPADWANLSFPSDQEFVWDTQITVGGDATQISTLDWGDGSDPDHPKGTIKAVVSGNVAPDVTSAGVGGPCTPWVTLDEVAAEPTCHDADGNPLDRDLLGEMLAVANHLLWVLSGQQYSGVCTDTVRPSQRWYRYDGLPRQTYNMYWPRTADFWSTDNPYRIGGNTRLQEITLGRFPIRTITEVRANGSLVDPTTYRIDDRRYLVNLDLDTLWPAAQDLSQNDLTQPNTFQVTFTYGQDPPPSGVRALKQFAIELAKGASGNPCNLPERVQTVTMQGVSVALLDPMVFMDKGRTGLYLVDLFLVSVNPNNLRRRSAVFSHDIPRPVRRVDTTPASS